MSEKFQSIRLEFHILQSFPVSCLNRDDLGTPKSAVIGGVPRARVSSQCWKRAVRLQLRELGVKTAQRTKLVMRIIAEKCLALGATVEQASNCGKAAASCFTKNVKDGSSDTLLFISDSEAEAIAKFFQEHAFNEKENKDLLKVCKDNFNPVRDGMDIALFGRMVAEAPEMNVEAAASFAHAISTHRVDPEIDFFTALEDQQQDKSGAAHMGTTEFNSATYYRYVSLDLGQLAKTMKTEDLLPSVEAFVKALFLAVPAARQATMSAASPWDYAIVTLRQGQRMQLPFNSAVKRTAEKPDIVVNSIQAMKERYASTKQLYGSLFGLKAEMEIGLGTGSVDTLLDGLRTAMQNLS